MESPFCILRKEQCKTLPLEKLYLRLEALQEAESKQLEDIRRKYAAEMAEIEKQLKSKPDGTQLIAAAGAEVLVYDVAEGDLIQSLKAHKDIVYAVDFSADGTRFASGGADKQVIIWNSKMEGILKYAYRENMTDVVIQHLSTDQRARIKCRDYVKKIAVFKDRLAVQLPDRVIIYELFHDDATDMHYRIKEKLQKKLECNLLVVTSQHIILCLEKKLQMYHFNGEKEREWNLEALIRYIKVTGGPRGREGLLVGLKNGLIFQIFLDNPFPIPLIKQQTSVRCLDLSLSRSKLAVVDEHNTCLVYDLKTKELLFQEPNANSVAWNTELEDMLCYSGNGVLNIKAGNFPSHQQKMQGFVVGFKGSKIFCLHIYAMTTVDVPQSASLERYLEKRDFDNAYNVACLGVTEGDWRRLATESLEGLNFNVAVKAFSRLRDLKFIDLIATIERLKAEGKVDMDFFLGLILAYGGKYHEAAKVFRRCGNQQKAIEMYTDLNMWEYATQIAEETNGDRALILKRKAQTQADRNDLLSAAATYIEVGDYLQAINLLGPLGSSAMDKLIELARKLNKSDSKALSRCVYFFRKNNCNNYAAECLVKLGNIAHLLNLYVELQQWDEAFRIIETHPKFAQQIYLPYANWLAMNDRYMEAQINFRKAGRLDEAIRVLEQLAGNAVLETRFEDAAYLYWLARVSAEKAASLVYKPLWENIDIAALTSRSHPNTDKEELLPMCYACSTLNPLTNAKGDACSTCLEPFVRSFYSFEILPLIEFTPAEGLGEDEVMVLIKTPVDDKSERVEKAKAARKGGKPGWEASALDIEFEKQITGSSRCHNGTFQPVRADRSMLLAMNPTQVFVREYGKKALKKQYFWSLSPEVSIVMCPHCKHFFLEEEWNYQYFQKGACHFCRQSSARD
ncbi:hypothetical protein HDU96_006285 [Phlyctochytrium bullatum]|nr:hypothetical protein HDU96_006285 [Phlyctochytrium bullatum]